MALGQLAGQILQKLDEVGELYYRLIVVLKDHNDTSLLPLRQVACT